MRTRVSSHRCVPRILPSNSLTLHRTLPLSLSNVVCGSLQCKEGERQPTVDGMDQLNSRTIISIKGEEYECK